MGMTMTTISNNLNANNFLKTEAAGSNPAASTDNGFSSILAMQAPAQAQNKPSSSSLSTQKATESSHSAGKAENGHAATKNQTSPNDGVTQADPLTGKENSDIDANQSTLSEEELNAAQTTNEAQQANLLAEPALLQQAKLEAGINTENKGKPAFENTLLSQLIEPQRNLASRLSGKNSADLEAQTAAGTLPQFVKDALAGSAKANTDTVLNTNNGQLTASQLAELDLPTSAGRAINLTANEEALDRLRDSLLGRFSTDSVSADPTDPRSLNLKTSYQPGTNAVTGADQMANTLLDATAAANAATASSGSVTNNQAQAPASPLISIGTSFYHPGWSQAMAQQLATQASLFFRQQANGTHIAQMRLDPPELGPIKVSLSIQDGVAQAAFVASNAAVRQALENSLADLHQALQEKGLSLGQAHVEQQDRQDGFFMEDNQASRTVAPTEDSLGTIADTAGPVTTKSRQHDGMINTFA